MEEPIQLVAVLGLAELCIGVAFELLASKVILVYCFVHVMMLDP